MRSGHTSEFLDSVAFSTANTRSRFLPPGPRPAGAAATRAATTTTPSTTNGILALRATMSGARHRSSVEDAMVTIITDETTTETEKGRSDGLDLWIGAPDAERATGWTLKPEGLCRDEICVPVPAGREAAFVRGRDVNIAGFWR